MRTVCRMLEGIAAIVLAGLGSGCTGPYVRSDASGFRSDNRSGNFAEWVEPSEAGPGHWRSDFYDTHPHNLEVGPDGFNLQGGGDNAVVGLALGENIRLFSNNPSNLLIEGVRVSVDGTVDIDRLVSDKATVIAERMPGWLQQLQTQGELSEQQAEVFRGLVEGGTPVLQALITALGGV